MANRIILSFQSFPSRRSTLLVLLAVFVLVPAGGAQAVSEESSAHSSWAYSAIATGSEGHPETSNGEPRWPTIHDYKQQDFKHWADTGFTLKHIAKAASIGMRTYRFQILDGRLYSKDRLDKFVHYTNRGPSRIWYWLWGLLELLESPLGKDIPNVDIVMNSQDDPQMPKKKKVPKNPALKREYDKVGDYVPGDMEKAPPPIFSPAQHGDGSYDIPWPLWTIWGEDVPGASAKAGGFADPPWTKLFQTITNAAHGAPFEARRSRKAFWRGSAKTSPVRRTLIACPQRKFIDAQTVEHKLHVGKPTSAVGRAQHRYVMYLDGKTFSGGLMPMIPTGALLLMSSTVWRTVYSRPFYDLGAFMKVMHTPNKQQMCGNVSAAVSWAEDHPKEAEKMAARNLVWATKALAYGEFQKYMVEYLKEWHKHQRFDMELVQKGSSSFVKYTSHKGYERHNKAGQFKLGKALTWSVVKRNVRRKA
ncbi:CAP10 domain-containing protein [Pseudoscourfieldia marina]